MKFSHIIKNFITAAVFFIMFILIIINFKTIFPALNQNALILSANNENNPNDIPSNLNFLNADKKSFITYCKGIYGDKLPLSVDNSNFIYFGTVDSYRLYRLQSTLIPYDRAQQSDTLAGHTFLSDCIYRPSKTGLYLIGDKGVFSLDDAYLNKVVDIGDVYSLYLDGIISDTRGLKSITS
jgi:hypothetical protein